jgi:nucleoside-diphosphate-sugar epimerase
MTKQTIFITGASGYIGGSVAVGLLKAGHRVRGLVRTKATADALATQGIDPILGTLDDADLLFAQARAADAVIDAASSDHEASARALVAGLEGSSKPMIHTSGASVVGDDAHGGWRSETIIDESSALVVHPAKQARHAIDLMVLAAAHKGVRSAVICPGNIYGSGRGLSTDSYQIPFLARNALRHGKVQIVGAGLNVWSNVHIDDVVNLFLLALDKASPGALYFAENGEASFAELGAAIATRLGLPGVESLDPQVAAGMWGEAMAYFSLGSNSRVRATRARQELGWVPRQKSVIEWVLQEMPTYSIVNT